MIRAAVAHGARRPKDIGATVVEARPSSRDVPDLLRFGLDREIAALNRVDVVPCARFASEAGLAAHGTRPIYQAGFPIVRPLRDTRIAAADGVAPLS